MAKVLRSGTTTVKSGKSTQADLSNSSYETIRANEIDLEQKVVAIKRIAKVVKGGRRFSFSAIVVVGDGNGVVGYGFGRANEVNEAITNGVDHAKKNLVRVPIYRGTVPHDAIGKYGGGIVLLKPAPPGTGVIAGGAMRAVLESAGIHDVLAKSKGSSNHDNLVKATFDALIKMRHSHRVSIVNTGNTNNKIESKQNISASSILPREPPQNEQIKATLTNLDEISQDIHTIRSSIRRMTDLINQKVK